jgi:hypothetical protein
VIEEIAERAVLDRRFVKGERERLPTRAFMIRVIVLRSPAPAPAAINAIRAGRNCYEALTREIAKYWNITDRNRHRSRKSKSP